MKEKMAIATMANDRMGDSELLLNSLEELSKKPYKIFLADGGSSEKFIDSVKKMGIVIGYISGGLTNQHKASMLLASDYASNVLYTEPDKLGWFENKLEESVDKYLAAPNCLSVVERTKDQFKTFPNDQQETETRMNDLIYHETGFLGDSIYGPKLFPSNLVKSVSEIKSDIGWGTLMFLVGRSHKTKLGLKKMYTAVSCPESDVAEKNPNYRIKKLNDNKKGLYLGLGRLKLFNKF